jgi:hypothetical protein
MNLFRFLLLATCVMFAQFAQAQEGPTIIIGTPKPIPLKPVPLAQPTIAQQYLQNFLCDMAQKQLAATKDLLSDSWKEFTRLSNLPAPSQLDYQLMLQISDRIDQLMLHIKFLEQLIQNLGC